MYSGNVNIRTNVLDVDEGRMYVLMSMPKPCPILRNISMYCIAHMFPKLEVEKPEGSERKAGWDLSEP